MDIRQFTALELGRMIKDRKIGCKELIAELVKRIDETEDQINAYTDLFIDEALAQAEAVQSKIDNKTLLHPLAGVPVAVKANISTKGLKTSCASRMLADYEPVFDAFAVERLKDAGAVIIGKCNMDEFAMGGSTETSFFGPTANPWDLSRVPGGSSGGCAAAIASGEAGYALGSDTGGSIRQPCSFCNVTGIKPTYGSVSRYGLVAYGSSLDQIGPMGKDIDDCAAVLACISGKDLRDQTSSAAFNFGKTFGKDIKGMKIGLPKQYFSDALDAGVGAVIYEAVKVFENLGAEVKEFDLCDPLLLDQTVAAYYIIACAEASSNLSRYDGIKYGEASRSESFGSEVKRRLMLGAFVLSAGFYDSYYKKALGVRDRLKKEWDEHLSSFDIIASPVAPTTAYKIGENINDPMRMLLGDIYTVAANMTGLPSIAFPAGFSNGLPVGMQVIGKAFSEPTLVHAVSSFQSAVQYHKQTPVDVDIKEERGAVYV